MHSLIIVLFLLVLIVVVVCLDQDCGLTLTADISWHGEPHGKLYGQQEGALPLMVYSQA